MESLYWKAPDPGELAQLGLIPEDFPPPDLVLWPENVAPLALFARLSTQWRASAGGLVGLDYNVVFHELDRLGIGGDDYDDQLWALGVIEQAALRILNKKS